jgi:uncharacterized protein (DUF2141 family)
MLSPLSFFAAAWLTHAFATPSLPLDITNLSQARGRVFVAVYDQADAYMDESKARFKQAYDVRATGSIRLQLPDLGAGNYAIGCYHDLNGNGRLDTNLLGVPTEPYGFSNNVRPKFRAPTWDEARFFFSGKNTPSIRMEKW